MLVVVALSGGIDSRVAAALLLERGYRVAALTMRLGIPTDVRNVEDATSAAKALGIPHAVCDVSETWHREVLTYYREAYRQGLTPNPCVRCNACVKFGVLPSCAREIYGDDIFLATGHYARLKADSSGRMHLFCGRDVRKDQSYFLYRVPQEVLSRTLFPLGEMTKDEVRAEANRRNIQPSSERAESQDFCGGTPDEILQWPSQSGTIEDAAGRILGHHDGCWRFTIGQRKGLGIGGVGEPYYVARLDMVGNRVIVARRDGVQTSAVMLLDKVGNFEGHCRVKVRSTSAGVPAEVTGNSCRFDAPVFAAAPGQSAVFYDDAGEVLGGGIIDRFTA